MPLRSGKVAVVGAGVSGFRSASPMPLRSCKVAVIGAGVSGLLTARSLISEGHEAVVFEKGSRVGGTWVYEPSGVDPVHSSVYQSLRINLPRELMGFNDYPFNRSYGDPRALPSHTELHSFIEDFAQDSGVIDVVRLRTEVVRVAPARDGLWVVELKREGDEAAAVEEFQAVVVCVGNNTEPRFAEIDGIDRWPGEQFHSHNYRTPERFQNKIVVIIGNGPSAFDISREISEVANKVHLSSNSTEVQVGKLDGHVNMWQHSTIKYVYEDGKVYFNDGSYVIADVIFHCSGYNYIFPFLETNGIVSVDDNRVGPLYKHVFPPLLAPGLSFVGIPRMVTFSIMELQAMWISQILSGKLTLPTEAKMTAFVEQFYKKMEEAGMPKHHTHTLIPDTGEYVNWLAAELSLPREEWRILEMYRAFKSFRAKEERFRDSWDAKYWDHIFPI